MDTKGAIFGGSDTGKTVPFPSSSISDRAIEQSGSVFGGENDEAESFYGSGSGNQVIASSNSGESLINAGPNYGEPLSENGNSGEVVDFATEIDKTLAAADANGDGFISANEELEFMDDQGQTISKNLTKLTDKQTYAVEKDINKQINKGDAYGAVISLQKWRDKMLEEAFGRHIGDRNTA